MSGSRHQRDEADAIEERRGLEVKKRGCIGAGVLGPVWLIVCLQGCSKRQARRVQVQHVWLPSRVAGTGQAHAKGRSELGPREMLESASQSRAVHD